MRVGAQKGACKGARARLPKDNARRHVTAEQEKTNSARTISGFLANAAGVEKNARAGRPGLIARKHANAVLGPA